MSRVLVIDESLTERRLVSRVILTQTDWDVECCPSPSEAFAMLEVGDYDIVVGDVRTASPDADSLLSAIVQTWPHVPLVLITAPGDEDEAVRALERGAASYVTRQHLVRDLVRVLQGVRAVKRRRRASDELFKYVTDQQYEFAIPSRRRLVSAAATYLQDVVTRGSRIDDISRVHVRVALEEALFNALIHGNFEITSDLREDDDEEYERLIQERERTAPYSERPIVVRARVTAEQAEFTIRDEGRGFNPKAIPDPTASGSVDRASGRGLLLIRSFMDEVQYNMAGNEITMRRSLAACTRRKPERAMAMS